MKLVPPEVEMFPTALNVPLVMLPSVVVPGALMA
jgi:hypothetical protein